MPDEPDAFEVMMLSVLKPAFEEWLDSRNLNLVKFPEELQNGDFDNYFIGIKGDTYDHDSDEFITFEENARRAGAD